MKTFTYVITEEQGIHARPAGALVKEAKKYRSHITLKNGDKAADATRLLAIMGMGTQNGEEVLVEIDGADEAEACQEIKSFFEKNL